MSGLPPTPPALPVAPPRPEPPPPPEPNGPDAPPHASEQFDQSWLGSVLRPLLVVLMVSSFAVVLTSLLARFGADRGRGFYIGLIGLAVLAALVGSITTTVLAQPARRADRSLGYRAAELLLFLTAVRLYVWLAGGGLPPAQEIFERPLDTLLNPFFVFAALIVGLAWLYAVEMTDDFNLLALQADEFLRGKPRHGLANEARVGATDRRAVLTSFTIRWVTLGLVLIGLAAVLRRGISFNGIFGMLRQDVEPTVLAPIIIYFIAGLLLLSHGRLSLLRARWTLEQTPAQQAVTRRWPWHVVALLGGVALLALLLPLGGTFLLSGLLSAILNVLFAAVLLIYRTVLYAILWLFSWLGVGSTPPPPVAQQPPPAPVPGAEAPLPDLLPPWAGGAFFWVAMALLVAYAAVVYLRDRGVRFAWVEWLGQMLRRRWLELRAALRRGQQRLNRTRTLDRLSGWRPRGFGRTRTQWSDPDAQVRYLYLSTLRSAETAGLPRHPAETPLAYAPRLAQEVDAPPPAAEEVAVVGDAGEPAPEDAQAAQAAQAVRALTDAFVAIRYAGAHSDAASASHLQSLWKSLQTVLRRRAAATAQSGAPGNAGDAAALNTLSDPPPGGAGKDELPAA